jgi:hypothetical protein
MSRAAPELKTVLTVFKLLNNLCVDAGFLLSMTLGYLGAQRSADEKGRVSK